MIEESLYRSNFVGRDGFRWWVGVVAPFSGEGIADQSNGGGWGNRTKVRIMGYHPFDEEELSNEDLPWAQVLLPTTAGSGAGNLAENTKLRPSDSVFGFFLDGDNAQLPVIVGVFGRTSEVSQEPYTFPFVPFTGYTGRIETPDGSTLAPNETNENNTQSQKSPRDAPFEVIQDLNQNTANLNESLPEGAPKFSLETPSYTGIGKKVPLANTCEDSTIGSITGMVNNLFDAVNGFQSPFFNLDLEISKTTRAITAASGNIVSNMFIKLSSELIPILNEGLGGLYSEVTAPITDATDALLAGVEAQAAFLEPIGFLQEALLCGVGNITNQMPEVIEELLRSVLDNAENFVSCVGTQFSSSLVSDIISRVEGYVAPLLEVVGGLLGEGLDIFGVLTSGIDSFTNIASVFECGQSNDKCDGIVKEYVIGKGVIDSVSDVTAILENAKLSREIGDISSFIGFDINQNFENTEETEETGFGTEDLFGLFNFGQESSTSAPQLDLSNCNTETSFDLPQMKIFGGGVREKIQITEETEEGEQITLIVDNEEVIPAQAVPVIGAFVKNADGRVTGSIVGAKIINPGFGYKYPPFVEIIDPSRKGIGAVARTRIDTFTGSVTDIIITSIGENYPTGSLKVDTSDVPITAPGGIPLDPETYEFDKRVRLRNNIVVGVGDSMNIGITSIAVVSPGIGYSSDDVVTDPFDIPFNIAGTGTTITVGILSTGNPIILPNVPFPELRIRSSTGSGALLKPLVGIITDITVSAGYTAGRLVQIIDCI